VKKILAFILMISMIIGIIPAFGLLDTASEEALFDISDELYIAESDDVYDIIDESYDVTENASSGETADNSSYGVEDETLEGDVSYKSEDDSLLEYELDEYLIVVATDETLFDISYGSIAVIVGTEAGTIRVMQDEVTSDNILQETQITITQSYAGISNNGIYVAPGVTANIKLDGVNIDTFDGYMSGAFMIDSANVTLELSGENSLQSGFGWAGLWVMTGSSLTINGNGSLEVRGGPGAAGIGGNFNQSAGTITINSGTINAIGGNGGAGIGGGDWGEGGTVIINGGIVTAIGGVNAMCIGRGWGNGIESGGTLTLNGNGVVFVSATNAIITRTQGIWFKNNRGEMFGDVTLEQDATIPSGRTLILNSGTLTNAPGVTLTNNGTILLEGDAEVLHGGAFGTILGNIPVRAITISEILGVEAPKAGEVPVTTITDNAQFTGTVEWYPNHSVFQEGIRYTATIRLTAREGFIFTEVPADFFTIAGALTVTNNANSSVITATFPAAGVFDITDGPIRIEHGTNAYTIRVLQNGVVIRDNIPQDEQITITGNRYFPHGIDYYDGIYIANEVTANIRLNNAGILTNTAGRNAFNINGGNVTLELSGTNMLRSRWDTAGLRVPVGALLTVNGSGSISVLGHLGGAGIGGNANESAGEITINSGTVTAAGGWGAGIGGGDGGVGGNITINGGVVNAHGVGGSMSIGGGRGNANGGILTLNGNGVVFASSTNATVTGTQGILFIGNNGVMFGDVTIEQNTSIGFNQTLMLNSGTLTIAPDVTLTNNGLILVAAGASINYGGGDYGYIIGTGEIRYSQADIENNIFDITAGPIRIEHGTDADTVRVVQGGLLLNDNIPREEQIIITGSFSGNSAGVYVASGVITNIKLNNVYIYMTTIHAAFNMTGATVSLELLGENTLRGGWNSPGIEVSEDSSITIFGSGSLEVFGGNGRAGIGRNSWNISGGGVGIITIDGGTITATGGDNSPGIDSTNGLVFITGGTVTAIGGGGVRGGAGISGLFSEIYIHGGIVTAIGGSSAAGVDSGLVLILSGDAVVFAGSIDAIIIGIRGILFIGNTGTVHRNVTLFDEDVTIPINRTLTVSDGASLTIPEWISFTNDGTIIPADGSTVTVNGTVSGNKINGANVAPPTLYSRTYDSVTLNVPELLAMTGQNVEFAINTINIAPTDGWQGSTEFVGLALNMTYYFFARSKEDTNFRVGAASTGLPITLSVGSIEITDIIFNETGTEVTVKFDSQTRATVIIAFYNEYGRFLGAVNQIVTSQDSEISDVSITENARRVRVMIWDGFYNKVPLDDARTAVKNDSGDWVPY